MELGIGGLGQATEIGAGASAVVYRALQLDLDREVAVKVLSATDEAFVRRFHREAMTLGKLSLNPGIVTVHGTGVTESGHPYLILELCESSVLDHLKSEGRFDPESACLVGAQVADAVSDAHNNGVVHRDIKPGNLLRSQNGRYLITDFGISTVRGSTLGQTDSIGFTAGYVAPETLRGEPAGTPSDVYALGATLFHMLSGYPPFVDQSGNSNLLALAQRVINDPIPDLRPYGVPDDVCRIVEAAMAKHPSDRPSAAQLRDQLQAAAPQANRPQYAPPLASANRDATIYDSPQMAPAAPPVPTTSLSPTEVAGLAPPTPSAPPGGFGNNDQTAAMDGFGGQPASGVLLGADSDAAVPPGRANYPLPPHSDDGPQPWKILILGVLVGSVILLATIAIAIRTANNDDGIDTTDAAPESPTSNDDASEGGADADGEDSGSNALPGDSSTTLVGTTVAVPDVVGQTEGDARSRLIGEDFEVVVQEQTSATARVGSVVAQEPDSGADAEVGSVVLIFVAVRPEVETVTIPNLTGLTEEEAVIALAEADLLAADPIREFSELPEGQIISSDPAEGSSIDSGSSVVLVISNGPTPPECSALIGLTETAATDLISPTSFTAEFTRTENATEPEGQVTGCTTTEAVFNLVVSDGPEICGAVTGMKLAEGTAALQDRGYTVTATGALRPDLEANEIFACTKEETTAAISYAEGLPTECPTEANGGTAAEARVILQALGFTDFTVERVADDTVPAGQVIDCKVSGAAVTLTVSTGPEVQTGNLAVTLDSLEVEGECVGDGLRPDLYGDISISYDGEQKEIWNRPPSEVRPPNPAGRLKLDVDKGWPDVLVGKDLVLEWDLKDLDREGRAGDDDGIDDDVSAGSRTLELTGDNREWRPTSAAGDPCAIRFTVDIKWSGLSN